MTATDITENALIAAGLIARIRATEAEIAALEQQRKADRAELEGIVINDGPVTTSDGLTARYIAPTVRREWDGADLKALHAALLSEGSPLAAVLDACCKPRPRPGYVLIKIEKPAHD